MAQIAPFRGVRYAIADLRSCVAPPYDVISEPERQLLRQFPYNITHLTLPDSYESAARLLRDWLKQGVLCEDPQPAYYLLEQLFTHPITGEAHRRLALVCLMKLEEYESGVVLPHENTQARVKEDRLNLLRATQANLEPIYGLVESTEAALFPILVELANTVSPLAEVHFTDGMHRLRRLDDPSVVARLTEITFRSRVWIADGHHRYETSLQYRREQRAADTHPDAQRPYDWLMIALTPLEDTGIVILPTHRVVLHASDELLQRLPTKLQEYFDIQLCAPPEAVSLLRRHADRRGFAAVLRGGRAFLALLKEDVVPETTDPGEHSATYRRLDVTLLHSLVLDPLFGISRHHLEHAEGIRYSRDEREAVGWVIQGEAAAAFLLNAPAVQEVREIALAGEKMPPKSTYFYPKLLSGLLMRLILNS